MYIRSLTIEQLRCFEHVKLELNYPRGEPPLRASALPHLPNVTLLLGDNGAGKTTVLRAVALSTLAPVIASGSGYVPFSLVRRTRRGNAKRAQASADVLLGEQDGMAGHPVRLWVDLLPTPGFVDRFVSANPFPKWTEPMYDERSSAFLVLGYGATRRVEPTRSVDESSRSKERFLRYLRVAGLFEENVTLMPLSTWLPRWRQQNPGRHKQVIQLMNQLLPEAELLATPRNGEYLFRIGGAELPFTALSDGYRAYVGWVSDLLYHICMGCPSGQKLVDNQGIVLIDEIDLHLHPQWQRRVIPTLSQTLPNLQFVLTTHSPLVAGTLSAANVLLIKQQVDSHGIGKSVVEAPREEMYGLTADQILTSDFFGLESTRDARFFERLQKTAVEARGGGPEAAVHFMRMISAGGAAERPPPPPPVSRRKVSPSRKKAAAGRKRRKS